jgi:alpha-1,2-mannosyltransferase
VVEHGGADIAAIDQPSPATAILRGRGRASSPLLSAPSRSGFTLGAEKLFLAVLPPALLLVLVVARYWVGRHLGFDYRPLWEASRHLFNGESVYPAPHAAALQDEQQFVYPPLAAVLAAPLAVFPFGVAAALLAVMELGATVLTLSILGVRDWRCYGVVFLWYPVLQNLLIGSITSLLALGLAVIWRYRDDRRVATPVSAVVIAAKVFLWPMLFWLAATRRWLTAVWAVLLGLAGIAVAWAVIGFGGLTSYPRLLDELSRLEAWKSYSVVALGLVLGLSTGEARALAIVAGTAVLIAVLLVGRRRADDPDADRRAFVLAIGAAFLFSPIVWTHYLALLVVPIAVTRRRLTPVWFVPLAMWATTSQSDGQAWRIVLGLSVWVVVLAAVFRAPRPLPAMARAARPIASLGSAGR